MEKISAIIVDDEELGRSIIREFLMQHPNIEIIAECRDAHEALRAFEKWQPQLLFLDIQMPEINGFELLEMLPEKPRVIFSTAYDQYAIKAFDINAIDYLLKPYDNERFNLAVERALNNLLSEKKSDDAIERLLQSIQSGQRYLERLLIKQSGRILILSVHEINLIQALDDYAEINTRNDSYLIQHSLNHLEKRLDPDHFIRVHRSYIVNIDAIRDIVAWSNGRFKLFLKNGKEIFLSRNGYQKLKRFTI
ncbi:MAG: LytR/AlgR family response regulator transcription factor [Candidatus Zhuqueibacterota bacterium]